MTTKLTLLTLYLLYYYITPTNTYLPTQILAKRGMDYAETKKRNGGNDGNAGRRRGKSCDGGGES
jgi:hypothetical protein